MSRIDKKYHYSPIIEFDRKVGRQIRINKRAEFTFPNKHGDTIESNNNFPQRYEVIIGKKMFSGGLYKHLRPYYYFEIHRKGHSSFFKIVENKGKFHVKVDLIKKIVHIE